MEHFIQVEATCAKCQRSQSDTIEKQKPFCKLETKHCVIFALSMYLIWSNIMFHARLKDNELQLADLQQRLDMLSESYQNNNAPNTQETNEIVPNETTEDTELSRQLSTYIYKQANTFPAAMMKSAQSLRTKREAKTKKKDRKRRSKKCKKNDPEESDTRDKRTGSTCPYTERPSFFIRGADGVLPAIRFLWQKGNNSFDRNIDSDNFQAESSNAKHVWGMRIKHRGLYFVFVQLKVAGRLERRSQFPAVGFSVIKRSSFGNEETIGSSFITQDQRGASYLDLYESYPVDTVQFSGLVNLQRDEILFVQRLGHQLNEYSQIRFEQNSADAHFGTFMVSGECG